MSAEQATLAARGNVPNFDSCIPTGRGDQLAIRRKGDAGHFSFMAAKSVPFAIGGDFPDSHRAIRAALAKSPTIGRKRQAIHILFVPRQNRHVLPGVGVPKANLMIAAAGGEHEQLTGVRRFPGLFRTPLTDSILRSMNELCGLAMPRQPKARERTPVPGPRAAPIDPNSTCQSQPIRRKGETSHFAGMPAQDMLQLAGLSIPEFDGFVPAGRGNQSAARSELNGG